MLSSGDRHKALKSTIRSVFDEHKGRYGYRRVTAAIRGRGGAVNHKTVQRLMVEMGLKSLVRPKKYRSYKGQAGRVAPDLLQRQFWAKRMNQKWATDVTEFNVAAEKLFLSPVMDLHNGEIIAFETARRPIFKLVKDMLDKAVSRLNDEDGPILHSDQGGQYQMPEWSRMLESRNIAASMSRKGNCFDNAAMESFFATLKSEFFYPNRFDSIDSLRQGVEDYIHYYNNDRIRMKLKGLSPVQYRTQPLNHPSHSTVQLYGVSSSCGVFLYQLHATAGRKPSASNVGNNDHIRRLGRSRGTLSFERLRSNWRSAAH